MSLFRRSLSTQDKLCLAMRENGVLRQRLDDARAQIDAAPSNAGRALAAVKKQRDRANRIAKMNELRAGMPGKNWRYL